MSQRHALTAAAGGCLLVLSIRLVAGLFASPPPAPDPGVLAAGLAAVPAAAPAAERAGQADSNRQREQLAAYRSTTDPQTRATLIVGLARSKQYAAVPLLLAAMEDDNAVVAGRAFAAVQHLLGVRYPVDQKRLRNPKHRQELAGMAREDWQKLRRYPRFQQTGT